MGNVHREVLMGVMEEEGCIIHCSFTTVREKGLARRVKYHTLINRKCLSECTCTCIIN